MDVRVNQSLTSVGDCPITPKEYKEFCDFLEKSCGIVLGGNKEYLITSRLARVCSDLGVRSLGELLEKFRHGSVPGLRELIVDAMTTNETCWFRDVYPYEALEKVVLPDLFDRGVRHVRVWSAASSTGQEPYSIAMAAQECMKDRKNNAAVDVQVMATDISSSVLRSARQGVYDQGATNRGLSAERRSRFFLAKGEMWQVRDEIRRMVTFKEFNLVNSYEVLGRFHVVFCRNVLIYFSPESKRNILAKMARIMEPGGCLFMGASEAPASYSDMFDTVKCEGGIFYRLKS